MEIIFAMAASFSMKSEQHGYQYLQRAAIPEAYATPKQGDLLRVYHKITQMKLKTNVNLKHYKRAFPWFGILITI
jgi:hypothetical protein